MHATFLYEQHVHLVHETLLKCLQTLQMQLGMCHTLLW